MFNRRDEYVTTPKRKLNIKISMRLIEDEYTYFKLLLTFKVVRIWFYDRLNIEWQKLYFQLQRINFVEQLCRLVPPASEGNSQGKVILI